MNNQIKERPILFNGAMVRAVLSGSKTQTRRILKNPYIEGEWSIKPTNEPRFQGHTHDWWLGEGTQPFGAIKSPYGQVGDQLWVRETFQPIFAEGVTDFADVDYKTGEGYAPVYPATDKVVEFVSFDGDITTRCTPSIHMPRWASRIQLEITGVRVERLNDCSEADAVAEGIERVGGYASVSPWRNYRIGEAGEMSMHCSAPTRSYMTLWESINGEGSWAANPWVWVIEFKVIKP